MTIRRALALAAISGLLASFAACGSDGLLQGEELRPDGRLPIEPASERPEAGAPCEAGACDASADAPPNPLVDASSQPTNTCETARAIGTIAGDTGNARVTSTGSCSEWLSVRATEDSSSALGAPMKVKLTLEPGASDFDLYAYYDPVRDVRSCVAPFAASYQVGATTETIGLSWGEGSVANGSDDGRTIHVLVLKAGGPCSADAGAWRLTAAGNE